MFLWIRALPGSPANPARRAGDPDQIAAINEQYGLNKPIHEQYWAYLAEVRGAIRLEHRHVRPVFDEPRATLPGDDRARRRGDALLDLVGIPLGFLAAKRYGSFFDHFSLFASLLGISIPIFFLAIILKYIFAVRLGLASDRRAGDSPSTAEHPTNFYILDAIIDA